MSDTMLLGVLRMPVDDHGDIGLMQFIGRAREAADRIEADAVRIEALESAIKFQASAAKRGMDAASSVGYHMEKEARRLHAECSPEALESERDANAKLTEELERALGREQALAAHVERLEHRGNQLAVEIQDWLISNGPDDESERMLEVWEEAKSQRPATSLARRDALKQAEAIDDAAEGFEIAGRHPAAAQALRNTAEELRRQAEENKS